MTTPQSRPAIVPIEPLEHRIAPAVALVDLGALGATEGFKINGVAADDLTGFSVSAAGDVNRDGRADFIVSARLADLPGRADAGAAYVVFGSATGFGTSFDLSALDGTNGFKIVGEVFDDFAGHSVSGAGDVNRDGYADLLVGTDGPSASGTGANAAYIVYGKKSGFAPTLDLSDPSVTKITGEDPGDLLGFSAVAAGDVNGDRYADIIIGAPSAASGAGVSYVIFGKKGGLGASVDLGALNGANGFQISGQTAGDNFGGSVAGAGDVNRDGYADLIIGAEGASTPGKDDSGAAYVVFGKRKGFAAELSVASLNGANGFKIEGAVADDGAGSAVSAAGDVNGDGYKDLLIGARSADRTGVDSGSAYVVFGKRSGFAATLDLAALNGLNGFEVPGHEAGAQLGGAVSNAGDMNNDGYDDILLGAAPITALGAGSAYAVFGKHDGFATSFDLSTLNGINGFRIDGETLGDAAGFSVSAAGDLNKDGFDDILIGAPRLEGANGPGTAYVIYGTELPVKFSANGRTAILADTDGDLIVVKVSKGRLGQDDFTLGADDEGLLRLNLSDDGTEFQGASISIYAVTPKGGTGDGLVNVGAIDASGIDLRNVAVRGDLGQIDAGDANLNTTGLAKLSVRGLGSVPGTQPGGTVDPLHSEIAGNLGSFASVGDVLGAVDVTGSLGAAAIRGNLDGSAGGAAAGLIQATASIGKVGVTGSILGGADASGLIAGYKLGRVAVTGDITSADAAKPVSIFGGGTPLPANPLTPVLAIGALSVKGDVLNARILADTDVFHSQIDSNAAIGNVAIRGTWTDSLLHSTGNIGKVTVLGDFIGTNELGIIAGRRLAALTFGGDVGSLSSAEPLIITAVGDLASTSAAGNLAIASIVVKGNATNAWFLAGYGQVVGDTIGAVNRDASIGKAVVLGSWNASNLVAGVIDATQDGFGRNDTPITIFDNPALVGRIGVVVIAGEVTNGGVLGGHFAITAEQISAARITGDKPALTSAPGQSFDFGTTGDFKLIEV